MKEFTCNDCGKQFKRKDKLREHVQRMHTDTTKNSDKQEDQYETPPEEQHNGEASTGKAKFIPKVSKLEGDGRHQAQLRMTFCAQVRSAYVLQTVVAGSVAE